MDSNRTPRRIAWGAHFTVHRRRRNRADARLSPAPLSKSDSRPSTWTDLRNGATNYDIYAQRVSAAGLAVWGPNGAPLCTATRNQRQQTIVPDGVGGAIVVMKHNQASVLVLDMHNEYGFDDVASDTKKAVKGLKTLFKGGVRCVGLGAGSTIRGNQVDFNLEISTGDISTSDIETLSHELNLRETTPTILNALYGTFKDKWFAAFRSMSRETVMIEDDRGKTKEVPAEGSVAKWAMENGVNVMAAEALHDKLRRLFSQPYIVDNPAADSVAQIIQSLEAVKHVVLSFGEHESDLDYLLVRPALLPNRPTLPSQEVSKI